VATKVENLLQQKYEECLRSQFLRIKGATMDAREINRPYEHDLVSRTTVGNAVTGVTGNDYDNVFSDVIDISKHTRLSVAIVSLASDNGINYKLEVSDNPNDETPVWAILVTNFLYHGDSIVIEKAAVGKALRIMLQSSGTDAPAEFMVFYRINP
jgi:hypothetical protein